MLEWSHTQWLLLLQLLRSEPNTGLTRLKSRCGQGWLLLEPPEERGFLALSPRLPAFLGWWLLPPS